MLYLTTLPVERHNITVVCTVLWNHVADGLPLCSNCRNLTLFCAFFASVGLCLGAVGEIGGGEGGGMW